jgi:hypothetical protein
MDRLVVVVVVVVVVELVYYGYLAARVCSLFVTHTDTANRSHGRAQPAAAHMDDRRLGCFNHRPSSRAPAPHRSFALSLSLALGRLWSASGSVVLNTAF